MAIRRPLVTISGKIKELPVGDTVEGAGGGGGIGDSITLPAIAPPVAPAAGNVTVFYPVSGNAGVVSVMNSAGEYIQIQPSIMFGRLAAWMPSGNATTIITYGVTSLTATGTVTSANVATTDRARRMRRVEWLVTTPATTAVAGYRAPAAQWTIGAATAGDGGFYYCERSGPAAGTTVATNRSFRGLASVTTAPTDVEPSSITNIVGYGWDAADTNIQIMHRGTGAITKIDTGLPVPTTDRNRVFEFTLYSPPGITQSVYYKLQDLNTGGSTVEGVITTNLPTNATFLAPRGWTSVGGTSSVVGLAFMGLSIWTKF